MKEDSQDRQLAMATKTPPLKRIRAFSNSFKIISARLKSQMLVNFPGVEFLRTIPKFTKKEKNRMFKSWMVQRQQRNVLKSVLPFARAWMLHVVLITFVIDVPFRSTKWEKTNSGGDTFHESRPGSFEVTLRTRKSND